jgi:putative 4-mercaptohistidine N1-methyltranferase
VVASYLMNVYETPKLLAEYLLFHYGTDEEVLPWAFGPREALGFAVRSVTRLLDTLRVPEKARALDLGCAVGRSCYELADHCGEVLGIDYSHAFISAAERLLIGGSLNYSCVNETCARKEALVALRPRGSESAGKIRFTQGDAMDLRSDLGSFEVVHAANLLCRLPEPQRMLERLPALVEPGGQLLLTTPCTWLEEFTAKEHWPQGGSTLQWLKEQLSPHFQLEHQEDLPFLIREHERKYQWSVALGTRWVRK